VDAVLDRRWPLDRSLASRVRAQISAPPLQRTPAGSISGPRSRRLL